MQSDEFKNYFLFGEREFVLNVKEKLRKHEIFTKRNHVIRKMKLLRQMEYSENKPKWHAINKGGVQMQFCFSFEEYSVFLAEGIQTDLCYQWQQTQNKESQCRKEQKEEKSNLPGRW